jgi:hypothetical protein
VGLLPTQGLWTHLAPEHMQNIHPIWETVTPAQNLLVSTLP